MLKGTNGKHAKESVDTVGVKLEAAKMREQEARDKQAAKAKNLRDSQGTSDKAEKIEAAKAAYRTATIELEDARAELDRAREDSANNELRNNAIESLEACKQRSARWLEILPSHVPPTRTELIFSNPATGEHHSVEWDPAAGQGLTRWISLAAESAKSSWHLALHAEPVRDPLHAGSNYAWSNRLRLLDHAPSYRLLIEQGVRLNDDGTRLPLQAAQILLVETCGRNLVETAKAMLTRSAAQLVPEVTTRSMPGLGVVGDAADDLAASLVRAALRYAKDKALRRLKDAATGWLCELTLPETAAPPAAAPPTAAPPAAAPPAASRKLLPRTCTLFQTLDLRSLATNPEVLVRGLMTDGVRYLSSRASEIPQAIAVIDVAMSAALELTAPRTEVLAERVQAELARFLALQVEDAQQSNPPVLACTATLAAALLADCDTITGCDPAQLIHKLSEPSDYFELGSCKSMLKDRITPAADTLRDGVLDLMYVLRVAKGLTSSERVQRLVSGLWAMARASLAIEDQLGCAPNTEPKDAAADKRKHCELARDLGDALDALTHADLAAGLDAIRRIASLTDAKYGKAFGILTAIGRYAVLAKGKASAELIAGARDEVEASLLALLDSVLLRSQRSGSWVVSAGIGAQLRLGLRVPVDDSADRKLFPPFGAPLSISATYLRREPRNGWSWLHGVQVAAVPIDLANYAGSNAQNWRDVLQAATSVSFHLVDADTPLTVGITGGWRPTDGDTGGRNWFITADVGVFLPLLDFN